MIDVLDYFPKLSLNERLNAFLKDRLNELELEATDYLNKLEKLERKLGKLIKEEGACLECYGNKKDKELDSMLKSIRSEMTSTNLDIELIKLKLQNTIVEITNRRSNLTWFKGDDYDRDDE